MSAATKRKKMRTASGPTPAQQLLALAKSTYPKCRAWPELHNAIYGIGAPYGQLFPTQAARTAFAGTPEFRAIQKLLESLPGPGDDPVPSDEVSGKVLLRMPVSLHAALVKEAEREGVSLNQLMVAKLSAQLREVVGR